MANTTDQYIHVGPYQYPNPDYIPPVDYGTPPVPPADPYQHVSSPPDPGPVTGPQSPDVPGYPPSTPPGTPTPPPVVQPNPNPTPPVTPPGGQTNNPTGEVFTNYNVNTGEGNVDQAYLQSAEGQAYLRDHPAEAFMYYIASRQPGGLNSKSDSHRAWLRAQQGRAVANFYGRSTMGDYGLDGGLTGNQNLLNMLQNPAEGFGGAISSDHTGDILRRLAAAATPGTPKGQELMNFLGDPKNQATLQNMIGYSYNPASLVGDWVNRLPDNMRPSTDYLGSQFVNYLRGRYA